MITLEMTDKLMITLGMTNEMITLGMTDNLMITLGTTDEHLG